MISRPVLVIAAAIGLVTLSVGTASAQTIPGTGGLTAPQAEFLLQRQQEQPQQMCCKIREYGAGPSTLTPAPMPEMPDIAPPQSDNLSQGFASSFASIGSAIDRIIAREHASASVASTKPQDNNGPLALITNASSAEDARVTANAICRTHGLVAGSSQQLRDGILFSCVQH